MARTLQKQLICVQAATFADWFAELRHLAGQRWPDGSDQAPTAYAVWAQASIRHEAKHGSPARFRTEGQQGLEILACRTTHSIPAGMERDAGSTTRRCKLRTSGT
jgi:hypothetical protein